MELRRQLLTTSALSVMVASAFMPHAHANPIDGVVSAGSADIASNGKTLDITQHSDKAIIDWRGFDIAHDETTNFYQPSSSSIIVNRVHSSQASQIDGRLNANGNVIIINQNGLVFGAGAVVDVHGLVVSTSDLDNTAFMTNAPVRFTQPGNVNAAIVNHGTITAHDAGLVGFVAPHVENHGVITANLGRVHLATGDKATVDFYGDGLMEVEASDSLQNQILNQTGTIIADGGKIALSASAGGEVVTSIINAQGTIRAQSVGVHNGEIVIGAKKNGKSKVNIAGSVDASSATGKGGKITVTADHIALKPTANLNASGLTGGGTIKVGGDRHGQGATPNAKTLTVEQGSYIANNALDLGDGGETVLWSDLVTYFAGGISGTGGANGGDGGFVEVSGKDHLEYQGHVDLSANEGYDFGNLLLDPSDIIISSGGDTGGSFTSGTYTASAGASVINTATLQSQITAANVTISTAGGTGGNGDITFANSVAFTTTSRTLTLNADRDIVFNASAAWTAGNGGFTMTAARDILFNANVSANGSGSLSAIAQRNVTVGNGVTVRSASSGGTILRAAGGVITNTGVLTNNGIISVGTGTLSLISGLDTLGERADISLDGVNLLYTGATTGSTGVTGFRDVTIGRNFSATGSLTIQAERHLTINSGVTLSTTSTGNINLKASNTAGINGLGYLSNSGTVSAGTGSFTLASGVDGSGNRPDLVLNSSLYSTGATVTGVGVTGFRDITVARNFTSTGSITISAERDLTINTGTALTAGTAGSMLLKAAATSIANAGVLTLNGSLTLGTGTLNLQSGLDTLGNRADLVLNGTNTSIIGANVGTTVITGFRDVTVNRNLISALSVNISAERNLTIGSGITVATGAAGGMTLRASTTAGIGGTGVLNNNGTVSTGTGTFVLLSGLDTLGERVDLNLNNATWVSQGASHTGISLTGFRDITVNRDFTTTGSITMSAERHFTNNANLTSGAASSMLLRAASSSVANIGLWSNTGTITAGSASLALQSGRDSLGNRVNLNLNNTSDLVFQGASFTGVTITGFGDVVVNRDITSTGSITIAAEGSITNNAVVTTGAAGALSFRAATSSVANVGTWTNNGTLSVGTGTLTISAGADGSGGRQDLVLNNGFVTRQGANFGSFTAVGFRDITLNTDILSAGSVNLTAERNLTVNSAVTTSLTGALHLRAAGALVTNQGVLTLNAPISTGSSTLVLLTGLDTTGNATTDLLINNALLTTQNATVGSINISGFRDLTIDRAFNSTGSVTLTSLRDLNVNGPITSSTTSNLTYTAGRDLVIGASQTLTNSTSTADIAFLAGRHLTINSGAVIKSGLIGATTIRAANAVLTNQGVLTINGTINASTGTTTLLSGLDLSGNRTADFTLSDATMTYQGAVQGALTVTGFRDVTVARNLTSSTTNITAERNLTINPGVSLTATTTGTFTFRAAGGLSTNTGTLVLSGATISVGTGALTLVSGMDESGNRTDLTLDNSNLTFQGVQYGCFESERVPRHQSCA